MRFRPGGKRCLFAILCALLAGECLGVSVRAQTAEPQWEKAAGGRQQFEVASVRENKSGGNQSSNFSLEGNGNMYWVMDQNDKIGPEGNLFRATNATLMRYIIFAYKLSGTQELALRFKFWAGLGVDVPAWVNDTHFDIEARAPASATKDQMRLMMQSLLADRFKLQVHWETREAPVFALALEKPRTLGPQLQVHPASDTCAKTVFPKKSADEVVSAAGVTTVAPEKGAADAAGAANVSKTLPIPCGMIARLTASAPGLHRIGGRNVTLAMVAESLPAQTGLFTFPMPVIDETGINGTFDFSLEWTQVAGNDVAVGPNAQGDEPGPSIAQALKKQLGLKLESTKGSVELLVIDHVERPTEN